MRDWPPVPAYRGATPWESVAYWASQARTAADAGLVDHARDAAILTVRAVRKAQGKTR